jgi:uncharacterized membrane protein YkgB
MINQDNIQSFIKWANILGILSIVFGALAALAGILAFLVGAIPGVLLIIAGVKLLNTKKAAEGLVGIEDPAIFTEKLDLLITESTAAFKFQAIYYIASLILGIIGIIVYIAVIAYFISNMPMY